MSLVSDGELKRLLQDKGVNVGPINDSTRGVYQRKLISLKGRLKTSKKKAPFQSASPKPGCQTSIAGVKRQRADKECAGSQVGTTNKKPRPADSFSKSSPHLKHPKKLIVGKEPKLYPDLSAHSSDQPSYNQSPISPAVSKQLDTHGTIPQSTIPKPSPPVVHCLHSSPLIQPTSFSSSNPSSSQSNDDSLSSFDLQLSSQPYMPEVVISKCPILSPEPKGKGMFQVVINFFGSRVSRLLNASGSFNSPSRKLSLGSGTSTNSSNCMTTSASTVSMADVEDGGIRIADLDALNSSFNAARKRYDWELDSSEVVLCKRKDGNLWRLGKGGFGVVFKGLKDAIDEVAVKRISLENYQCSVIEQFKQEIDMISKLRHRHIVQFYGACIQPQNCYMVTELMDSDLFSMLRIPHEAEMYKWSGVYGKDTLIGVASGLHYLHSRKPPVVHRDIKSPNILVMAGLAKIADVGIARTMGNSDMTAQKGYSMAWASPEVVYRKRATEKIDIWSLGIIIWEVASGKLPKPGGKLELPGHLPPYLNTLYTQCVHDNPTRRPSALEVTVELKSLI